LIKVVPSSLGFRKPNAASLRPPIPKRNLEGFYLD